jgi:hypothetical protein
MKVIELIKELANLNPDAEILISSDSEGNSICYIYSIEYIKGSYVIYPRDNYRAKISK